VGLSALELRSEQYGTIRAQSCVRGNVNPQISRLCNGPDRDPNPARRSLDLRRQHCPASCEERRGISKSAAVGAGAGLPCSKPASFQFGRACATLHVGQRHGPVLEQKVRDCPRHAALKRGPSGSAPISGPVVFRGCYKLHRRTEPLQFNHGHSLTIINTSDQPGLRAGLFVSGLY
jgi:hypothetical protein